MSFLRALPSGLIGAVTLNVLHETARRLIPDAPHIHVLGMRAIAQSLRSVDQQPPPRDQLFEAALVGDVVSNALYYSAVGLGKPKHAPRNGALLGLAAGVGAVLLPGPLGLGKAPSARTSATAAMTVAWYLVGGLVSGLAYRMLARRKN
ncbi:MAG: hypothetical protein LH606_00660 [Cytophagaceae bacterium]|nr:hypothetical protein [Cytophagaceae bacterium]